MYFALIYIKCESSDDWDNFFKIYNFFLKVYQLMSQNLKKETREFLLITFSPDYDWRIYAKLLSDKIIINDNNIKNVNANNFRKLV